MKLDKTQPYGTITPPHNGAFFEQGGVKFDHEGNALSKTLKQPAPTAPEAAPEPVSAPVDGAPDWSALITAPFMSFKSAVNEAGYQGEQKKAAMIAWLKETGRL